MSGDDRKPPPEGQDRTVFMPPGTGLSSTPPAQVPEQRQGQEPEPIEPAAPTPPAEVPPPPTPAPSSRPGAIRPGSFAQSGDAGASHIQPGDVLNHIFEVKRFIARGGMGEVFEGINVNSEERVAIKVMLPALAADANVLAMFRKEARTLTRLSHPALVQYRVLAQEPQLGVFYIVTEFVDGQNLSDVITTLDPSPQDLRNLLKRLAEGLSAAHALGAIHRDISPDNVMLEGGRLAGARIIDFGIAKDLDPGSATIIGDGFAGKLNYVAPEQLGDYGRSVGPWTDVYSLGLLVLAVAQRRDVDMGGTLVNAVDKRRAGPDISAAPEELRPLLEHMLRADPKERPQSMGEVLELLRAPPAASEKSAPPVFAPPPTVPDPMPEAAKPAEPPVAELVYQADPGEPAGRSKLLLILAGAVGALAVLGALAWQFMGKSPDSGAKTVIAAAEAPAGGAEVTAREVLAAGLPGIACTWIEPAEVTDTPGGLKLALRGVAGDPANAQGAIARLFEARKIRVASLDFEDVSPIHANVCTVMDVARQIRDPVGGRISVPQREFEMSRMTSGSYAGAVAAKAVINFNLSDPNVQMSLFGIEPSGRISQITRQRSELLAGSEDLGNGQYRLTIDINHEGWSGLLLLSGEPPFDGALLTSPNSGGADGRSFLDVARQRDWKAEIVWFKTEDKQPN